MISLQEPMRPQQQNTLEILKIKLRTETNRRINKENQVLKIRNIERSLKEELHVTKVEIDFLTEKLEDIKDKICETTNQIQKVEIQKSIEKVELEYRANKLKERKNSFEAVFRKEQDLLKLQNKEMREKEAQELELIKQNELEIIEKNKRLIDEAASIERECETIEQECAVLKKRNNAIMLKLRRRLVETEDKRRKIMQNTTSDKN